MLNSLDDEKDSRVLLLIAVKERKPRIETSKNAESLLTNDECASIIKNSIVPEFENKKYFNGIYNGLIAIVNELEK